MVQDQMKSEYRTDEVIEELLHGRLKVIQKVDGYRFSIDAVLLGGFTRVKQDERIADLGTGCGVIPLILSARTQAGEIVGIEIDGSVADMAARSVALNRLEERVSIIQGNVRNIRDRYPPESFDTAVANPPYGRLGAGRVNPQMAKASARHEVKGGLADFLAAAAYLLKYRGRMSIIYPARRLPDVIECMRKHNIEPKRLRSVHSREGEGAVLVLVEGVKGGGVEMDVLRPLYIYNMDGNYTSEVEKMYG